MGFIFEVMGAHWQGHRVNKEKRSAWSTVVLTGREQWGAGVTTSPLHSSMARKKRLHFTLTLISEILVHAFCGGSKIAKKPEILKF